MEAFWERFEIQYCQTARRVRGRRRQEAISCSGVMTLSRDPWEHEVLLAEILEGRRTAIVTSLTTLEQTGRRVMGHGEFFILTDNEGAPRAVIRTMGSHIRPFRGVTAELAMQEGIDTTLAAWQARWRPQLTREAQALGVPLSLDVLMAVETFQLAYQEA